MTRIINLKTFAWLAVLSVMISGEVFAQATHPSLVTQQMRISDGGGNYINIRAGTGGTPSDPSPYFLDAAPNPFVAGQNYSLWLNDANHIVRSTNFGLTGGAGGVGGAFFLERVNATGTGLEWVDPASLIRANNGLSVDNVTTPGSPTVQIGGPLIKTSNVDQAGFDLSFTNGSVATPTNFILGNGTNVFNVKIDPSATGNININNMQADLTATDFMVLDATKNVKIRSLASLVVADNGLSINAVGGFVELGGPVTGTNPLLVNRFVTLGGKDLNFDGAGNFNIGDGTSNQNITLDPSATGNTNFKNLPNDVAALATDRFVMMSAASDKVQTRLLTSLVNANNGLIVDNALTPGTSTVQLGAIASADVPSALSADRWINMNTHAINFEQNGSVNLGVAGNMHVTVFTGTQNFDVNTSGGAMTLQSTGLASANSTGVDNLAYVNSTTHEVHTLSTANMTRNDAPTDFIAIDPVNGTIIKAISPTAGIFRGHTAWNGGTYTQTITLPATQNILANASVTATNENHTGEGTVAIQVTNVVTGLGTSTFTVEASDILPATSFINWVIVNP